MTYQRNYKIGRSTLQGGVSSGVQLSDINNAIAIYNQTAVKLSDIDKAISTHNHNAAAHGDYNLLVETVETQQVLSQDDSVLVNGGFGTYIQWRTIRQDTKVQRDGNSYSFTTWLKAGNEAPNYWTRFRVDNTYGIDDYGQYIDYRSGFNDFQAACIFEANPIGKRSITVVVEAFYNDLEQVFFRQALVNKETQAFGLGQTFVDCSGRNLVVNQGDFVALLAARTGQPKSRIGLNLAVCAKQDSGMPLNIRGSRFWFRETGDF